jgi:hypothetical protein
MIAQRPRIACLGLRAKTARAIAVVVAGTGESPQAFTRAEIRLSAPETPGLFQPFHRVMDLPWDEAKQAVRESERAIEAAATRSLKSFLLELSDQGLEIACVAIVGAPERKLESIGSPHIRAHAAEGVLFRHVWQVAAEAVGVPSQAFSEKAFELLAATRLALPLDTLRSRLVEFGNALGRPWRADEKAAAMAAWIALTTQESVESSNSPVPYLKRR